MSKLGKRELSRKSFRATLEKIHRDSKDLPPERYSPYWFFMRYVRRLLKIICSSNQPKELDSTIRGMTRFYIDLDEPPSILSEQFESIRNEYSLIKRIHQNTRAN